MDLCAPHELREPPLPPPLIHELRTRSFPRLFRMTGNPGNRGFGRYLRRRIVDVVRREGTTVEQAITVAYLGCYLVDHLVNAERSASRILESRDLTEAEEHRLWETNYPRVIRQILSELPDPEGIVACLCRLHRYTELPGSLACFRSRHWSRIERVLGQTAGGGGEHHVLSEVQVLRRIQRILSSNRPPRAKARAIRLLASLLADQECWLQHVDWPNAYLEIMTDLYPAVSQHPAVLEQLV